MIDWHEIARHEPIRRLGEVLRRQLNVWVGFLGPMGLLARIGDQQAVDKPLCDAFMSRRDHHSCQQSVRHWFEEISASAPEATVLLDCHASLKALVTPITVKRKIVAACFVSGFILAKDDQESEQAIFKRGKELNLNRAAISHGSRELVRLSSREVRFVSDLLQAIADSATALLGQHQSQPDNPNKREHDYSQIVGASPPIIDLFRLLDKVVESDSTVLIQGDAGVGKELVARAIHFNSHRADGPFVVQNCSALNDSLLDSELFGHKKGSFTGAICDKQGLFEIADHGTFFLDEIGDMSPMLQVKLLRVIQEGTFLPVGDTVMRKVDVRIIAATNRDLRQLVQDNQFRNDLYYRINVINIHVPALRERKEDLPLLINRFLDIKCAENNHPRKHLSKDCLQGLINYDWPGNVRELENEIERLVVLSERSGQIPHTLLSPRIRGTQRASLPTSHGSRALPPPTTLDDANLPDALEQLEREMILDCLRRTSWNKTKTAKELGISRRNLIRKVDRYQLDALRNRPE